MNYLINTSKEHAILSRESEGSFRYGNYRREADDLRSVIQHFLGENLSITAIVGHSKGLSKVSAH